MTQGRNPALAVLNGVLALALELAAVYLVYRFGALLAAGWVGVAAGLGLSGGLVAVWARWVAPKAVRRLTGGALVLAKSAVFGLAVLAAAALFGLWPAVAMAIAASCHLALARAIGAM